MGDGTQQGGLDLMSSDELVTLNGAAVVTGEKVQRVKPVYGVDGDGNDPVKEVLLSLTTAGSTAALDCSGYRWISVHLTAVYTGQTTLTFEGSNDNVNWRTVLLFDVNSTSTAGTSTPNQTLEIYHGPVVFKYFRLTAVGTGTALTTTAYVILHALPSALHSLSGTVGVNGFSTGVAPAISNHVNTIGTATGNHFQVETNSSADRAAASFVPAVASQIAYITDIYWSIWGSGTINTPRLIALIAAGSPLARHDILAHPSSGLAIVASNGCSGERKFRNPWKTASAVNQAVNLAVTSHGAAIGNWQVIVEGYYQSS